jgi:Capsule assembly protein Wzi/PAP2 superfamily
MRKGLLIISMLLGLLGAAEASAFPQTSESRDQKDDEGNPKEMPQPSQKQEVGGNSGNDVGSNTVPRAAENLGKRFLQDQEQIWTSPAHLTWADADLLVPVGIFAGTLLGTDTDTSKNLSNSPSRLKNSTTFSNYGLGAMVGLGGGLYAWGQLTHDEHKKETGIIAGEAALNSYVVTTSLNYAFGRDRPLDSPLYQGEFWHGGTSMPSDHAAISWAVASVVAHEYPGKLTQILAYGLAGAISMSRVSAKQHFPSDVFIGSLIGWYAGKQAYRAHHDPELGGDEWRSYGEFMNGAPNERTTSLGTTFVPLDSWIYPALERLIALGYVRSDFMGMRPWSRFECATMVTEAGGTISDKANATPEVQGLYSALAAEFAQDAERLGGGLPSDTAGRLESTYSQVMGISGPTLHDGYHFGQTIYDDFGRPYGEGVNLVSGASGWVSKGRFALYVRGEYDYAPSSPTYSPAVNQAIATMDENPVQPGTFPTTSKFNLLDTYISSTQSNWILSFGKQSLWWGPGYGGDLILSDNAAPIWMLRASRVAPFEIPLVSRLFGPIKLDFFYGKLASQFPQGAQLHGEKISFKPLPGLELGFDRTGQVGGVSQPVTLHRLWETYTSITTIANFSNYSNPGKRTAGWDFNWRLPHIGNWLTIYNNSLATDNVSPIQDITRAGLNPGMYLSHFPIIKKLDLRIEAVYTDTPEGPAEAKGEFIYWDSFYHDLYTNQGNLIGSWIGRQGKGYQAWSTYHVSARNWIQFAYRHSYVNPVFVPRGGTLTDGSISANWWLRDDVNVTSMLQYERWFYPLLAPGPQKNWTSSIGFTFYPRDLSFPRRPDGQN